MVFLTAEQVEEHSAARIAPRCLGSSPEAVGDLTEPLPPMEFGRIAAQSAKQVIAQKVQGCRARAHV
jgi:N utilization substance protein A